MCVYVCVCIYIYVYMCIRLCVYTDTGKVGAACGGAGAAGPGSYAKPYASHTPYNVACAQPVLKPYTQPPNPKPRQNGGSKPEA